MEMRSGDSIKTEMKALSCLSVTTSQSRAVMGLFRSISTLCVVPTVPTVQTGQSTWSRLDLSIKYRG